jgi:oligopeptide transport system substrate-binding protein
MNHLYHYDIYNDPSSSYRKSEQAMQAIVNLYGVEYGEGKLFETLEEAHDAITGYNLTDAKALMKQACDELVAAELYTAGAEIKIQIGWAKGALTADDEAQCDKIEQYLNAAIAGSGFGAITLEPIGNIPDRYGDVPAGNYAIGYGAWGGAAFYPFRNFQVYMDPEQYDINEAGCWDPKTTKLTLTINGEEVEMSYYEWCNSMVDGGKYANADNETKLTITAALEENFLKLYYRIPLAITTVCSLNSYKIDDYTDTYNIMYGFGGFRIMDYNYTDAEWADYVAGVGGELDYH